MTDAQGHTSCHPPRGSSVGSPRRPTIRHRPARATAPGGPLGSRPSEDQQEPSRVPPVRRGGRPMTDTSDRLRYVLDGVTFPVDRWELIARAEHYGADAATLHD